MWKVLRDDFGMNASMKNWDNEDESSNSEDEEAQPDEESDEDSN